MPSRVGQLVSDVDLDVEQRPAVLSRRRVPWARGVLPLAIIILGGTWLRFYGIGDKSLWLDEGCSIGFARLDWHSFVRVLWGGEANMAFYYLLLRAWTHLGDSVTMLRGLSVFFSLGTILVVYLLGRKLFSNGVGLTAAVLLAVNAYSVRYAQEVRSYSLVTLLSATATLIFTGAVKTGRKRDWLCYIVISVLAVYAHFFAVLVVVAHGASLMLLNPEQDDPVEEGQVRSSQDAVRRFWYSAAGIGLCTLPVWAFIAITGPGPIAWNHRIGLATLPDLLLQFSGQASRSFYLPCSSGSWTHLLWSPLLLLYLALAATGSVRTARQSANAQERWLRLLPLYWFVLPVIITLAFSLLVQPVFHPRYLNICLPALVLIVASGVMSLRETWLRLTAIALVCGFGIGGVHAYYSRDFDLCREDFRGASEYVLAGAVPGDVVVLHPRAAAYMFDHYARQRHIAESPKIILPNADLTRGHKRVWVVTSMSLKDGESLARESVSNLHRLAEKRPFEGVQVYLYEETLTQRR